VRAAAYVRVSTEDQARNGYSLGEQELQCRQYAAELGATECEVFRDEGVSGGLLERPGLTALRNAVKAGAFSVVVCKDPDRLSRELVHQLIITDEIERSAQLRFVNFARDSATPEGNLFFQMRGVISQFEKAKITQRMTDGRRQKARNGEVPVFAAAYGYDYSREGLALVESEAAVVRRVFDLFTNQGKGPQAIARLLTEEGVPTKRGAPHWHRGVVRKMLLNSMYRGVFHYGKRDYRGTYLNKYRAAGEKLPVRPADRDGWIELEVPRIVDDVVWFKAYALLEDATRLWKGHHSHQYLLSGLARCGRCGRTMPGTPGHSAGKRRFYYSCRRGTYGAEHDCTHYAPADALERAVWGELRRFVTGESAMPEYGGQYEQEMAEVDTQLKEQQAARKRLVTALEKGLVEEADLTDNLTQIKTRITALQSRRADLADKGGMAQAWAARLAEARATLPNLDFDATPFEDKQTLLRKFIREVRVYPEGKFVIEVRASGQEKQLAPKSKSLFLIANIPARRAAN
jgi:site-specific DNA recombinase